MPAVGGLDRKASVAWNIAPAGDSGFTGYVRRIGQKSG